MGLPHTDVTEGYEWCAYTSKLIRFPRMLRAHGYEPIMYAGPASDVPIIEPMEWDESRVFDRWEPSDPCWQDMNASAVQAIAKRIQPSDMIGIIAGRCQQQIVDAFPDNISIEWGVGYVGALPNTFRAFESRAHQAYVSGWNHDDNGRFFDTVIPNAYDPAEFDYTPDAKDDYLLFIGRLTERKGLAIVAELAKKHRVIVAGQGDERILGAEHVGIVRGAEKRALLAGARALVCPTTYLEPFGGVAVEAMFSGTPVIATPFGAFPETVKHGVTGFLCHTLAEFYDAAVAVDGLSGLECRKHAESHFSLGVVGAQYDAWLTRLGTLYGDGFYATRVA